jgi:hypothetical protein
MTASVAHLTDMMVNAQGEASLWYGTKDNELFSSLRGDSSDYLCMIKTCGYVYGTNEMNYKTQFLACMCQGALAACRYFPNTDLCKSSTKLAGQASCDPQPEPYAFPGMNEWEAAVTMMRNPLYSSLPACV